MDHIVVEPDARSFRRVARALDEEAGGTEWRTDAAREIGQALEPGVTAVKGALWQIRTGGLPHGGESMRQAISDEIEPVVTFTGPEVGALIRVGDVKLRNFEKAPRRFNARRGFRHPVPPGGHTWVTQLGAPGWFDDTLRRLQPKLAAAAADALERRARRISRKAPG
jgi:hypothetical protein